MPKAITDSDVRLIAKMIRNWPNTEKLTWENICTGSESILGYKPSRQALDKKLPIDKAYEVKKKQIRSEVDKLNNIARPRSTLDAMERLARLEAENAQLRAELQKMAEVAQRFIYNASIAGLTREKLMRPLPSKKQ